MSELPPIALAAPVPPLVVVGAAPLARSMMSAAILLSPLLRRAVLSRALLLEVVTALLGPALAFLSPLRLCAPELLGALPLLVSPALFRTPFLDAVALVGPALALSLVPAVLLTAALFGAPFDAQMVTLPGVVISMRRQVCGRLSHTILA